MTANAAPIIPAIDARPGHADTARLLGMIFALSAEVFVLKAQVQEMKAALLNKDKKQASGQKQKKTARAAVAVKRAGKAGKSSSGFKTGGSAYDPLNGKL